MSARFLLHYESMTPFERVDFVEMKLILLRFCKKEGSAACSLKNVNL
jgi:hypothetical protein